MNTQARYIASNTPYLTTDEVYKIMDDNGYSFIVLDNKGRTQLHKWHDGMFVPVERSVRRKWFTVPDYQPNGTPATTAHVVDAAGQEVATFERIADAEAAVAAVNNATGE